MATRTAYLVFGLWVCLLGPSGAFGVENDPLSEITEEQAEVAVELLETAELAKAEGRWEEALGLYREVFELLPLDEYRLHEAYCLVALERLQPARDIAAELASSSDAEIAAIAGDLLNGLDATMASFPGRLRFSNDPLAARARVWVDDVEPTLEEDDRGPFVEVTAGAHRVALEVDGGHRYEQTLSVEAGGETTVELPLPDPAPSTAAVVPTDHEGPDPTAVSPAPAGRDITWTYALGGAALASLGVGITFGVLSSQREDEAESFDPAGRRAELEALRSDAETYGTAANVAFVAAATFALGAVVALFLADDGDDPGSPSAVTLAPIPFARGGGASLGLRF